MSHWSRFLLPKDCLFLGNFAINCVRAFWAPGRSAERGAKIFRLTSADVLLGQSLLMSRALIWSHYLLLNDGFPHVPSPQSIRWAWPPTGQATALSLHKQHIQTQFAELRILIQVPSAERRPFPRELLGGQLRGGLPCRPSARPGAHRGHHPLRRGAPPPQQVPQPRVPAGARAGPERAGRAAAGVRVTSAGFWKPNSTNPE
jgi:hypothetical protein